MGNGTPLSARLLTVAVAGALTTSVATSGFAFAASPANRPDSPTAATTAAATQPVVPGCGTPVPTRPDNLTFRKEPAMAKVLPTRWRLNTNCGPLHIRLFPDRAPQTVNSIRFLSKHDFYNRTTCHRLTTSGIFVLQCGDPSGTGAGGPGYTIPDENLPVDREGNYPVGTVAMANAGPGTGGSQFFIVYRTTTLPAAYTIIGKVTPATLTTIRAIAHAGTTDGGSDGPPRQPVTITTTRTR